MVEKLLTEEVKKDFDKVKERMQNSKYESAKRLLEEHNILTDEDFKREQFGYLGGVATAKHWERYKKEKNIKKNEKVKIENLNFKKEFEDIKEFLKTYMDMPEENINLVSVWIIGTYLHKQLPTYPYLFFNAMRGSGKTRILNIISAFSRNGGNTPQLTEAVLFRTASQRTFCIDEFENMNAKGNENLKLLLNSAYKKGGFVERMEKTKTIEGEKQTPKKFFVYAPIVMANIWGIDNVLADRCIKLNLEKSSNNQITRLILNLEHDENVKKIKEKLEEKTRGLDEDCNLFGELIKEWNSIINPELKLKSGMCGMCGVSGMFGELLSKIKDTDINSRDLELFLPIFVISYLCGKGILDKIIGTSKIMIKEKQNLDMQDNADIKLYEFIAQYENKDFISVSKLTSEFKEYFDIKEDWCNSKFLGKALRRLVLVKEDRKTNRCNEVKLNIEKAKEKILIFKPKEEVKDLFSFEEYKKTGLSEQEIEEIKKEIIEEGDK